ncbi:hypothetical protein WJX79_006143 [Trebouxia sp. C0005]
MEALRANAARFRRVGCLVLGVAGPWWCLWGDGLSWLHVLGFVLYYLFFWKSLQIDQTKRVTIPPGTNTLSAGPAAHVTQQQQALGPYAAVVPTSRQHPVQCHIYQYRELQAATADFSERNIIGEGGFGRVYKGRLPNGTLVAVKRLDRHGLQGDLEFNVEVSIMAGLHHAHVVPLLGSCCQADQRVAVFEYMPHGNLRDLLDGKIAAARHFNWPARLNVLLGVAKGLAYLHEGTNPAVVHRDLKSSNILIDGAGQARICDFGLARHKMLLYSQPPPGPPPGGIMTGTFGYMAPEYATSGQTTDKSDVYAFGVVVLEMMTGMQAVDARRPTGCEALPQLLQPALQAVQLMQGNLDPALNRHASLPAVQLAALCEVAASCLEPQPTDRPTAARLVTYLQKLLKSTDSANTPVSRHGRTISSPPAGAPSPTHHPSASDTPRLMEAGRDLRDSAWGPSFSSQPPSAPLFPIRSSAQPANHAGSAQAVLRPSNSHRPTQSALPGQGKSHTQAGHLHTASSPYDQSLHQLVQSRTLRCRLYKTVSSGHGPHPASCSLLRSWLAAGTTSCQPPPPLTRLSATPPNSSPASHSQLLSVHLPEWGCA